MNLNFLHYESLDFTQYFSFLDGAGSELSAIFFEMFRFFLRYRFYLVKIKKIMLK